MFDIITKRKAEGGRMKSLIFSEHDIRDYSVKLESFLTDSDIKFAYLKGSAATMQKQLKSTNRRFGLSSYERSLLWQWN